jgi:hypothetical protein
MNADMAVLAGPQFLDESLDMLSSDRARPRYFRLAPLAMPTPDI